MKHHWNRIVQFIFGFSAAEANAFTILLPLLGLAASHGIWAPRLFPPPKLDFHVERYVDSLLTTQPGIILKKFDPNSADEQELLRIGMEERLVSRLLRYRSAGGKFRFPEDLLRLHGMDTTEYIRLRPWISLPPRISSDGSTTRDRVVLKRPEPRTFDLNRADSSDFEACAGIGPKTAARIVKYRAMLGGFIRWNQLYEVWAIDSLAVFAMDRFYIAQGFVPQQMNLNMATEEVLDRHPYLSRMQAKAILFYRYQHGPFRTLDDLRRVRLLDSLTIRRISPYLILSENP